MSYDRYLAICYPLHYANQMSAKFCVQLVGSSFLSGFLAISITIALVSNLDFCGPNEINHFFCDVFPLIELSCSDTHLLKILIYLISFLFTIPPFLLTIISYGCIISAILKITSSSGRQKAFSTCSSHLIVVTLFYGTITIVYILPNTDTLRNLNKVFSVFYAVLTPMVNPLVYIQSGQKYINKGDQSSKKELLYSEKLKNQFSTNEPANMWKTLKNITGYSKSPSQAKGDQQLADDLNVFYCRFEKKPQPRICTTTIPDTPTTAKSSTTEPIPLGLQPLVITEKEMKDLFHRQKPGKAQGREKITGNILYILYVYFQ
ncbi:olfactory receptor 5P81-like [Erythrolamprus reginae]|uniref:olfactory receptor 5P81-like n=1 Tax=Erythrolamprus reginae TaxID=121349 RepID=UPI00396C968A